MRVVLAGATGVIGSPLVPQLLHAGHEVTATTRSVLAGAHAGRPGDVAARRVEREGQARARICDRVQSSA